MPAALPDECAQLLDLQCGVIARWQLPTVRLDARIVEANLRGSRWQPLYRGIYAAFSGEPPRESLHWGAVLRAGAGAVLSHYSAAELDHLTDKQSDVLHVTIGQDRRIRISAAEWQTRAPRIVIHRADRIDALRHPARMPPRTRIGETILDLTQLAASFDEAFSWLSRGCGRRLVTPEMLLAASRDRKRLRWRSEILEALGDVAEGVHSNLEWRYLTDVGRAHCLPVPRRQARMAGRSRSGYYDNLYEEFGVVVELDGRAAHLVEDRWRDIRRDNFSARSGLITLRFSWADVLLRPCTTAADICDVLRLRGWHDQARSCGPRCTIAASPARASTGQAKQRGRRLG